jgi:hypothetical protein
MGWNGAGWNGTGQRFGTERRHGRLVHVTASLVALLGRGRLPGGCRHFDMSYWDA